jgi:hypothetical protein
MSYGDGHDEAPIDWSHCAIIALTSMMVFCLSLAAAGRLLRTGDLDARRIDRSASASGELDPREDSTRADLQHEHRSWLARYDSTDDAPASVRDGHTTRRAIAEPIAAERPRETISR